MDFFFALYENSADSSNVIRSLTQPSSQYLQFEKSKPI